jgi:hypothetical protein
MRSEGMSSRRRTQATSRQPVAAYAERNDPCGVTPAFTTTFDWTRLVEHWLVLDRVADGRAVRPALESPATSSRGGNHVYDVMAGALTLMPRESPRC